MYNQLKKNSREPEIKEFWDKFTTKYNINSEQGINQITALKTELLNVLQTLYMGNKNLIELNENEKLVNEILEQIELLLDMTNNNKINKVDFERILNKIEQKTNSLNNIDIDKMNAIKEKITELKTIELEPEMQKEDMSLSEVLEEFKILIQDLKRIFKNDKKKISNPEFKRALDIIVYIVNNHPLAGSRLEMIENLNGEDIKYEVLMGHGLAYDEVISEILLKEDGKDNRQETLITSLMDFMLDTELSPHIGINITKTHLKNILLEIYENPNSNIKYSVNISENELMDVELIKLLKNNSELLKNKVEFEFLEHPIDFNNKRVKANLNILFNLGYNFSIDDFGTSNSDFKRIEELKLLETEFKIAKIKSGTPKEDITNSLINGIKIDGEMLAPMIMKELFEKLEQPLDKFFLKDIITQFNNFTSVYNKKTDYELSPIVVDEDDTEEEQIKKLINEKGKIDKEKLEKLKIDTGNELKRIFQIQSNKSVIFEFIGNEEIKAMVTEMIKNFNSSNNNLEVLFQGFYNKKAKGRTVLISEYLENLQGVKDMIKKENQSTVKTAKTSKNLNSFSY